MKQHIAHITLMVNDYEETIAFYTGQLNFSHLENIHGEDGRRWVTLAPKGSAGSAFVLMKAENPEEKRSVGNQTGGKVAFFLKTDDIARDFENFTNNKVTIIRGIVEEPWGKVAIFADLYGNLWDLIEPAS